MLTAHRRAPVVAFFRPSTKGQPVPDAFWLSKGGEFPMPTRHGRQSTSHGLKPLVVRFRNCSSGWTHPAESGADQEQPAPRALHEVIA